MDLVADNFAASTAALQVSHRSVQGHHHHHHRRQHRRAPPPPVLGGLLSFVQRVGHHQPDRRIRMASLTEPVAVTWPGDRRLICYYACEDCGHSWTRADLWTAENAGFDPKRRRGAA